MRPFRIALAVLAVGAAPLLRAETWRLDPVHTQIRFAVDHLGFSRSMGLLAIREGVLEFDPQDWHSAHVDVRIDLSSLHLGDTKWQDAVKSWQFLHVTRWPEARFTSTRVEPVDARHATVHGTLLLHGIRQPVQLAVTMNRVGNDPYSFKRTAGFAATATIRRRDFGMDKLLSAVGDEVQLDIAVEAQRVRRAAPLGEAATTDTPDTEEDNDVPAQ